MGRSLPFWEWDLVLVACLFSQNPLWHPQEFLRVSVRPGFVVSMGDQEEFPQLSQWSFHPVKRKRTKNIAWDQQKKIMPLTLTMPDQVPVMQKSQTTSV